VAHDKEAFVVVAVTRSSPFLDVSCVINQRRPPPISLIQLPDEAEEDDLGLDDISVELQGKKSKKKRDGSTLRKAPQVGAPWQTVQQF
jgi:hypothetical protein